MSEGTSTGSAQMPELPLCPPDPVAMRDAQAFVHTVLVFAAGWAVWRAGRWWRQRAHTPRRRAPAVRKL